MYFGEFASEQDVCACFDIECVDGVIIYAAYEIDGYDGSAEVIFVKEGKFFHVSGSHCSCYGLDGQWEPEEMPVEALRHIVAKGNGPLSAMRDDLLEMLDNLAAMSLAGASPEALRVLVRLAFR